MPHEGTLHRPHAETTLKPKVLGVVTMDSRLLMTLQVAGPPGALFR